MIYKTYSSDLFKLLSLSETGMGYQLIEAALFGRSQKNKYCVYNSELILDLDSSFAVNKRQVFSKHFSVALREAKSLAIETNSITLIPKSQAIETVRNLSLELKMMNESSKRDKNRYSGGRAAIDSPKENADGKEIFVRVSAYENDRRVDFTKKRLIDGTFSTTYRDYLHCIGSQDDPVDRYALPNDETIKWAFYVQPKIIDKLQRGIVQPAFGHQGGGIEAYFEKGTSDNTYYDKRPYGK